ncbi:MAG: hypothetical protein JWP89_4931 [Schlesneria sp.]|nr:hypothetical protein [Schlesneria sp.]
MFVDTLASTRRSIHASFVIAVALYNTVVFAGERNPVDG